MDRRYFITRVLALGAAGFTATILQKHTLSETRGIDKDLSGVWKDPYLSQPSNIIIESKNKGSLVKVTGTYLHKDYGQSTFSGTGELKGNVLTINYEHENNSELGRGALRMELAKSNGKFALRGSCQKSDGSWSAQNMGWHKA